MWIAGLLIAAAALSQAPGQADAHTWVITKKNGERMFGVAAEDQFKTMIVKVRRDEPWLGPAGGDEVSIRAKDIEDRYLEPAGARRDRIRKGWEEHGGIEIETANGPGWVLKEEYELAEKARRMAGAAPVPSPDGTPPADEVAPAENAPAPGVSPPGFLSQWGVHLGIAAAATALLALVARTLILL